MKANELMTGDWVQVKDCIDQSYYFDEYEPGEIVQVREILDNGINPNWAGAEVSSILGLEDIHPMPLTPEILEKNGFMYCKSDGGFCLPTTISYGNWDVDVILFNVTDEYRNNQLHIGTPDDSITILHLMECNHVHELQHALRLCGIKKEIML